MGKYKVDCDPLMLECREGSMLPITYRLHKTSTDTYAECSVSLDPSDADDLAIWEAILAAASTSEAAWLAEMPSGMESWMSARSASERGWFRQSDLTLYGVFSTLGWV